MKISPAFLSSSIFLKLRLYLILVVHWSAPPSCWHATGIKPSTGLRRSIGWNYFPRGNRKRDAAAVKHIFNNQWESWPLQRQKRWGLLD
ncbi:hypothetical protein CMK22_02445 [Candidatus Poribacteria bacterium]|nr:hypothetical protein [Candidatus Poribacteria bacterium]